VTPPDQLGDGPCLLLVEIRKEVARLTSLGKSLAEIANRAETPFGTLRQWRLYSESGDALDLERALRLLKDWQ